MGERSDKLLGKKVTLSMNYEADHFKEMIILAGMIKAAGGDYEIKATNCDVFATFEKIDAEGVPYHCSRTDYVQAEIENGKDIEIITFDALLALLGISREELEAMPPVDTEYLIDEKYRRVETV